ncbi:5-oxoprolinase subunit C family protein [Kangiella shandongensis]|uniref:5-oxoprolinase subunit C family protein n=1 Tax=Kangiella shandongensis TaxID=2763258 RepID=UPI001CBCA2EA|nr:biotin-dependent carboxyltransferase family protein [Kangiella shandongensis]
MSINVLKAGLQTTIQDSGREGFREYGIASNGALDEYSQRMANWLVGKSAGETTLEITQIGPTLEFEADMTIGVTGANFEILVNDQPQTTNKTLQLKAGDVVKFGKLYSGARAYLAFSGQLTTDTIMGSQSTNLLAGFGGNRGLALKDGDRLNVVSEIFNQTRQIPEALQQEHHHNLQQHHLIVRFTQGREFDLLSDESRNVFLQTNYQVSSSSSRMAVTLEGENLALGDDLSMTTVPIVAGTVQLPSHGQPIITLADGQTTGGYPRIGQVISADLSLLAQLKPNDSVSFYPATIAQAHKALMQKEQYLKTLLTE